MPDAIEFALDDGTTVAVAAPRPDGSSAVGLGDRLQAAEKTLREALVPVTATATQVMDGFRELARSPQEIEIGFGVTLDGKLGGVIASANAGAHLDVTLRWCEPGTAADPTHEADRASGQLRGRRRGGGLLIESSGWGRLKPATGDKPPFRCRESIGVFFDGVAGLVSVDHGMGGRIEDNADVPGACGGGRRTADRPAIRLTSGQPTALCEDAALSCGRRSRGSRPGTRAVPVASAGSVPSDGTRASASGQVLARWAAHVPAGHRPIACTGVGPLGAAGGEDGGYGQGADGPYRRLGCRHPQRGARPFV